MKKKQSKKKTQFKKKKNYSEKTAFSNLEKASSMQLPQKDHHLGYQNMLLIEWQEEYFLQQEFPQY